MLHPEIPQPCSNRPEQTVLTLAERVQRTTASSPSMSSSDASSRTSPYTSSSPSYRNSPTATHDVEMTLTSPQNLSLESLKMSSMVAEMALGETNSFLEPEPQSRVRAIECSHYSKSTGMESLNASTLSSASPLRRPQWQPTGSQSLIYAQSINEKRELSANRREERYRNYAWENTR